MSRPRRRELRRAVAVTVQSLEARLQLSTPDVWVIKGDTGARSFADAISVRADPHNSSMLQAHVNGEVVASRAVSGLKQISIGAGRGSDFVSVELGSIPAADDVAICVWGGPGNDTIMGDSGVQCLYGGPGNDLLDAGGGNDTLRGDSGNDDLSGGDDADWMCGDAGNDTLAGNWGNDRLLGAAGNDFLDGGDDRDKVLGGAGNDTLKGGGGKDGIGGGDARDLKFIQWGIDSTDPDPADRTRRENTTLPVTRVSADSLRQQFRNRALAQYEGLFGTQLTYYGGGGLCGPGGIPPPTIDRGAVAFDGALVAGDHSSTNVQEAGVDEADVVEADGRYIYSLTGYYNSGDLVITDTSSNRVVARYDVGGSATGLYLIGGRLTIVSWSYENASPTVPPGEIASDGAACGLYLPTYYRQQVRLTVLDVSNPASPRKLEETNIDGNYVSSRAIDGRVYVVTSNYPSTPLPHYVQGDDGKVYYESRDAYEARLNASSLEDALPGWSATDASGRVTKGLLLGNDNTYVTDSDSIFNETFLSVALVDVSDDTPGADASASVSGYDGQVYASERSLYVAQSSWNANEGTDLFKFTLGADSVDLSATAKIEGRVTHQFSMDEEGEHFRVSTQRGTWGIDRSSGVQVLDQVGDELRVIGSLGNLAPGEQLFATRFVGNRGYLITFDRKDPLFTIDLSDPTRPRVAGELVIPGFSNYLHPIDETHLIGLGRDADENGIARGVQLSLFDVSDIANPKRLATYDVPRQAGTSWDYSVAEHDHHAFSYFPAQGVLAFPVSVSGYSNDNTWHNENRLEVVKINPTAGFQRLGAISHEDPVLRSVRIGTRVFSIGSQVIKVANLDKPSDVLATIDLTEDE